MNVARLYHTLIHLRFPQIYYRLYYKWKKHRYKTPSDIKAALDAAANFPETDLYVIHHGGYQPESNTFNFLNIEHSFGERIDWNYNEYGRLWTYNLNYFDWLNDTNLSVAERLETIKLYTNNGNASVGKEPYPISVRGINWIRFLVANGIKDNAINEKLYRDYHLLAAFPEYHLLANHLLENAFSLFYAAHYFNDTEFYHLAHKLLCSELKEQILDDGGHYEQSPMYHCILLQRLLQCIALAQRSPRHKDPALLKLMNYKAEKMLGWLDDFIFSDGSYAMVSDSAPDIAPAPHELFTYAKELGVPVGKCTLNQCGYRRIDKGRYELLADVGNIMPHYQPGHTHADTFSFCLHIDGKPFIVDTGISTYQKSAKRLYERGTTAHNTISIDGENSTDVWSGHRVGRRAMVSILKEDEKVLSAEHNGYRKKGVTHRRDFFCGEQKIVIHDTLKNHKAGNAFLFIHFHPDIVLSRTGENSFSANGVSLTLNGIETITDETYAYCEGYNKLKDARRIKAQVSEQTEVIIEV